MKKILNMKNSVIPLILILLFFINGISFAADIDEMTGQMIITGFKGNSIKSKGFKSVLNQVEKGGIGGVIFFEDNIKNKEEFLKMTSALKNSKAKHKPFISIDMEGGEVQRMNENNGFKNFKSAKKAALLSEKEAYEIYFDMAKELREANINLNFAPCVDLAVNKNSIIEQKERSYSSDPKVVAKYAAQFIKAHYDNKIITSIKHFPGHGSPFGDTHLGFVDATNTYTDNELYPYLELANLNPLQTVMVSHLYNGNIDNTYPASLSYLTIEKFLRIQTDFKGVIITDDLDMGAIRKNYTLQQIVNLAINSGENILLFSNRENRDEELAQEINIIIKSGFIDGTILPDNILNSYNKIIELKKSLD